MTPADAWTHGPTLTDYTEHRREYMRDHDTARALIDWPGGFGGGES